MISVATFSIVIFAKSEINFFPEMQCCSFIVRPIRSLNRQQFRCQSKSALFVSGKAGTKQFAVFKPKVDLNWVRENSSTLEAVLKYRNSSVSVSSLMEDLDAYLKIKEQVIEISSSIDELQQEISERKKAKLNIQDVLTSFKPLKKQLTSLRDAMWVLEEDVVMDYLKLQNCDEKSILREKVYYSMKKGYDTSDNMTRTHKELCELNNLAEFSSVSHSAYYLKNKLAHIELELTRYFTNTLLMKDFEIISNPDFVKSVMVEGCGEDFLEPEACFNLRQYQDFGDRGSGNAMHLAGGASLAPAVAYFARQLLNNPGVLPVSVFCVGRHYRPLTSDHGDPGHRQTDLVTCHQSQVSHRINKTIEKDLNNKFRLFKFSVSRSLTKRWSLS